MNKNRLKAILKYDAAFHAYWLFIILAAIGAFAAVDALFGHSRQPIPLASALTAAVGVASLTHSLLGEACDATFQRLKASVVDTETTDKEDA